MTQPPAGQHRDPLAGSAVALPEGDRPIPGPIAVLPVPVPEFDDAIVAAGGVPAALSEETRGVVWFSPNRPAELLEILRTHPGIGWVQLPWAGVDGYREVFAAFVGTNRPLWTSAKSLFSQPVAEHALALTLATLRRLPHKSRATSWAPAKEGLSLYALNVVIVGAGGIAAELLRLLAPFRVTTTIVRRSGEPLPGADRTVTSDQLLSVLPDADVVIIAAASTAKTKHLIGAAELAALRPTAVLVNVARGALVHTDALVDALREERIYGAGLDVTDPEPLPAGHPLWNEPLCIVTSHTADTPEMNAPLLAERIRLNTAALVSGDGRFVGIVDTEEGY
ncbi:MAG: D-isomer specific 2-hydroxyacid dehydrogenase family protein [Rhodoglobus sp.]